MREYIRAKYNTEGYLNNCSIPRHLEEAINAVQFSADVQLILGDGNIYFIITFFYYLFDLGEGKYLFCYTFLLLLFNICFIIY